MDLQSLVIQRGSLKGKLTRISNYVQAFNTLTDDSSNIKVRYDELNSLFEKIENVQNQIEAMDNDTEKVAIHEQERDANEHKFFQTKAAMERILNPASHNSTMNESQYSQAIQPQVKLPQLQLPIFDGAIKEWPVFKNIFKTAVDSCNIPTLHKFQYLKSSLKGEAAGLVSSLIISEANYHKAWDILIKRYENKTIIVNHHLKTFVNYSTITRYNLKDFLVALQQSLDSLRSLDLPIDSWDVILVFLITQKLDNSLRAAWEMSRKETTVPKFNDLLEFLNLRVTAFEMLADKQIDKPSFTQTRMAHLTSVSNTDAVCSMCNGSHRLHKCPSYLELPIPKRIEFVKAKSLCYNCLQAYQPKHNCSKTSCFTCRGKHHTSIHLDSPPRKVNYTTVADNSFQQEHAYAQNIHNNSNFSQQTQNIPHHSQQTQNIPTYNLQMNSPSIHSYSQSTDIPTNTSTYKSHPAHTSQAYQQTHSIDTHAQSQNQPLIPIADVKTASTSTVMFANANAPQVLLSTAVINVRDAAGRWHKARALLDSGSEVNIMSHRIATLLKHKLYYSACDIQGIGNTYKHTQVSATADISSRTNHYNRRLNFVVMDNITVPLPHKFINTQNWNIPSAQASKLADPTFFIPSDIDLLLGAEIFYDILQSGHIRLGDNMPQLIETTLGWVVSGSYIADKRAISLAQVSLFVTLQQTDDLLRRFWEQEEVVTPKKLLSPEQKYCEQLFQDTTIQTESGNYMVNLPILENKFSQLGNSFNTAYRCLLHLESRFQKDKNLHNEYKKFIHEFITLGHAEYITDFNQSTSCNKSFYLPHHAVLRPDSQTTKLRTVFNGSAKTDTGVSLNDVLLEGPNIYNDILDIILRFRLHKYIFTADIVKMFRNIFINPDHRPLQRLLWRDTKSDPLQCIQISTVVYGTKSAPYLACRTLRYLAEKYRERYPLAAECIQLDCYMDDFLSGGQSLEQVNELCTQLIDLLKIANFELHKWSANHSSILEHVHMLDKDANGDNNVYDFTPDCVVKTLGLRWMPSIDNFQIHIPDLKKLKPTKRNMLSQISQIFDPIGFLAPSTILVKILMQDVWKLKLAWDDELPLHIQNTWNEFCNRLNDWRTVKIPRCYFAEIPLTIMLIGFCDSSVKSFGGCLYLHATYNNRQPTCTLIMAKTRVAPIKSQSVPRLELCGALLLSQLTVKFLNATATKIHISDVILFTDSLVILNWIKTPFSRKLNPFVSHRLREIVDTTKSENWHYVNTRENPADLLTRGVYPDKLPTLKLWWNGPSWLLQDSSTWPLTDPAIPLDLDSTELASKNCFHVSNKIKKNYFYEVFKNYSSFGKVVRIIAFVFRFVYKLKNKDNNLPSQLTVLELSTANRFIIRMVQEQAFPKELEELQQLRSRTDDENSSNTELFTFKHSPLRKLNVFLDNYGLIRAGGRLTQSDIPYNHAHPIILPAKEHITTLIIRHYHIILLHSGTLATLSTIRFKYWPINGRSEVGKVIHRCTRCIRFRAQACGQQMADLPPPRVTLDRPFIHTGVDFSGAIYLRSSMSRNCRYHKAYICLFVCLATKLLHLELVSELTSEAFICALKRLIARRGSCKYLYSDNASNFKGANNELVELNKMFKNDTTYSEIVNYCTMNNIQWKFTIPLASHMGGLYEAGIKSVKALLKRQLCNAKLTYELMYTLLVQVEGILNSRPLCSISDSPNDLEYLTPAHFAIGSAITDLPEPNMLDMNDKRLNMYQKLTQIRQRIWKQFYRNYISELLPRNKWLQSKANLKVGDMIIIKDEATPPSCWPLGKVIAVNVNSQDGLVRSVLIKTVKGEYTRPIHKLILLPSVESV